MKFKFATWNVNFRKLKDTHLRFIKSTKCDVLVLQECNRKFFEDLKSSNYFQNGYCSLDFRPPQDNEGRARQLGCAIFSKFEAREPFIIEEVDFPERTLVNQQDMGGHSIQICSFHIPPGASWGKVKPETFKKLAKWLKNRKSSVILGIDANAPKSDRVDILENEWWWKDEPVFLGANPEHGLLDVYRVYLEQNPEKLVEIEKIRPEGPLAISHIRGNWRKKTPSRYDFIYATPDFRVRNVNYFYDEAIEAGSDHALVLAELEL